MPTGWDGSCEVDFGGDRRRFALAWRDLQALEAVIGPLGEALGRLTYGGWKLADVRETIRIGLEGSGASPSDALQLVRRYVERRPPTENVPVALAVLSAGLFQPPELSSGKAKGDGETATPASPSPESTETAP